MTLNLEPLRFSRSRLALLVCCLVWLSALCWWHRGVVMDDPWITFHYARNVVEGKGLVFNPGETVEGYSNFLWVWVSAAAIFAHLEPLGFGRLVSWLCAAAMLWVLCLGLGRQRSRADWEPKESRRPAREDVFGEQESFFPRSGTAAVLLVSCYSFAVWTMGGLETILHAFLVLLFVALLARAWTDGKPVAGAAMGLALAAVAMGRPEGAMYAGLPVLVLLVPAPRIGRRAVMLGLGVFAAIFAAYLAWRFATYGTLLPNTVSAKVGGSAGRSVMHGVKYFWGTFAGPPLLILAFGLIAALKNLAPVKPARGGGHTERLVLVAFAAGALQIAFAVAVGGDWMPAGRFFVPALAPLCLAAAWLLRGWMLPVRLGLVAFFLLGGVVQAKRDGMLNWCRWASKEQGGALLVKPLMEAGQRLRADAAGQDALLAATEAGVLPYDSRMRFIDMLGLVDKHIASLPGGLHEKYDPDYVLGRKPDYVALQFTGTAKGLDPTWPSDRVLFEHADFVGHYEEFARVARPLPSGDWGMEQGWLVLYRRTENGAAPAP